MENLNWFAESKKRDKKMMLVRKYISYIYLFCCWQRKRYSAGSRELSRHYGDSHYGRQLLRATNDGATGLAIPTPRTFRPRLSFPPTPALKVNAQGRTVRYCTYAIFSARLIPLFLLLPLFEKARWRTLFTNHNYLNYTILNGWNLIASNDLSPSFMLTKLCQLVLN